MSPPNLAQECEKRQNVAAKLKELAAVDPEDDRSIVELVGMLFQIV